MVFPEGVSMKTSHIALGLVLIFITALFTGCLAGPESRWKEVPDEPPKPPKAGFFAGLWHGFIAIPALILGIFTDIKIFESNNSGWWYELAFLLGVGAFSGGGIKASQHHSRKK